MYDAIVIGAGQAGLAAGYHLQQAKLNFLMLEAGDCPAGSWPNYYDSLKLFSPARYSSLPGMPFPGDGHRYPLRDEVIAYLTDYAAHFRLPVKTHTRVEQVRKESGHFEVVAGAQVYQTRAVIAATGAFNRPFIPKIEGTFYGQTLHSAVYKHPAPYRDQRVIVVGGGNSAIQIAVELAQVAHVTLASRHPIRFRSQKVLGLDVHFWAKWLGIDQRPISRKTPLVIDTGYYRQQIAGRKPDYRPMFARFYDDGVVWGDNTNENVDTVLFATGYLPNVSYLEGCGALDHQGKPLHRDGISQTVPGLYYVGLEGQRNFASATLRGVGQDARLVVTHLRRFLS